MNRCPITLRRRLAVAGAEMSLPLAAQAKWLAETAARAPGELALLHTQSHHEVCLVLTDDPRQQMQAARARARQP
jgi:hypothetical protein